MIPAVASRSASPVVYQVPAGAPERPGLIALLARGFAADAHIDWLLPCGPGRDQARLALFTQLVEDMGGHLFAHQDLQAAALWFGPGEEPGWLAQAGFFLRLVASLGPLSAMVRGLELKRMENRHPRSRHFYLQLLAVEPSRRCRGLGRMLVEHLQDRARSARCPVYLETSLAGNLAFYRHLGFQVSAETRLSGALHLWSMTWEPRAQEH